MHKGDDTKTLMFNKDVTFLSDSNVGVNIKCNILYLIMYNNPANRIKIDDPLRTISIIIRFWITKQKWTLQHSATDQQTIIQKEQLTGTPLKIWIRNGDILQNTINELINDDNNYSLCNLLKCYRYIDNNLCQEISRRTYQPNNNDIIILKCSKKIRFISCDEIYVKAPLIPDI